MARDREVLTDQELVALAKGGCRRLPAEAFDATGAVNPWQDLAEQEENARLP